MPEKKDRVYFGASLRVSVRYGLEYDGQKTVFKHSDSIQSMAVRQDGRLTAVGVPSGNILVVDSSTKAVLRALVGHRAAVKSLSFFKNKVHLVSAADDCTVKLWNITTGENVWTSPALRDFPRCSAVFGDDASNQAFAAGSYDHSVNVWRFSDLEDGQVLTLDHQSPVEAVAFLPGGQYLASAGLNSVKIWDLQAEGGRLFKEILVHHKTITQLYVHPNGRYLFTGSLDQSLKIIDLSSYSLAYQFRFASPVLCFSVADDLSRICVGLGNGSVTICGLAITPPRKETRRDRESVAVKATRQAMVVEDGSLVRLNKLDRLLKSFRYREALDVAIQSNSGRVLGTALTELLRREGLVTALSGRADVDMASLVHLMSRHLCYPQHTPVLLETAFKVFDIYANAQGASPCFDAEVKNLRRAVNQCLKMQESLMELSGAVGFLEQQKH